MKKKYNFYERKKYYLNAAPLGFIIAPFVTTSSLEEPIPFNTPGLLQIIIGNMIPLTIFTMLVVGNALYYISVEKYSFYAAGFRLLKWVLVGFMWLFIASLLGVFTLVGYQP